MSNARPDPSPAAPGVLVFAHVPPPHHGQSFAVQLLLQELATPPADGSPSLRVFHVDARLSDDIDAIGRFDPRKILRLLRYCARAIRTRLRHGPLVFYYVPAAPMRSAVYRDWLMMLLCRPWFPRRVYHWEAAGLAEWLETTARPWERRLTLGLLGRHTVSVVLARHGLADARALGATRTRIVPNGLPDPCPDFDTRVAPVRARRRQQLAALDPLRSDSVRTWFRVLYMGLCVPEKGLFDLVEAVAVANRELRASRRPVRVQLTVAGKFWQPQDRTRFDERRAAEDLQIERMDEPGRTSAIDYRGFLGGKEKENAFLEADAFAFPSYYSAESFGLVVAEAMAFGLPVVATQFRHIPELFPDDYPLLVEPRSPEQLSSALLRLIDGRHPPALREHYLAHYTARAYGDGLRAAILEAAGR